MVIKRMEAFEASDLKEISGVAIGGAQKIFRKCSITAQIFSGAVTKKMNG